MQKKIKKYIKKSQVIKAGISILGSVAMYLTPDYFDKVIEMAMLGIGVTELFNIEQESLDD